MAVRLSVNSSAPLTAAPQGLGAARGLPSAWRMGADPSPAAGIGGDTGVGGGDEGQKAASSFVYPSLALEDASSMNLSVAMRVGALPVIDPNGEAG